MPTATCITCHETKPLTDTSGNRLFLYPDSVGPNECVECALKKADREKRKSPFFLNQHGISLRDHFAGLALNGGLSATKIMPNGKTPEEICEAYARAAYNIADAMLKEREKKS